MAEKREVLAAAARLGLVVEVTSGIGPRYSFTAPNGAVSRVFGSREAITYLWGYCDGRKAGAA